MPTIEVSQETLDKIKDQLLPEEKIDISSIGDMVGKKFFIRTLTYHVLGKVEKASGSIISLSGASWIADSGRFGEAIESGSLSEIEYTGDHFVNFSTVVDFIPWKHDLPRESK